ncbi:MAG: radical SAM protein [Polyangiaceae bacterium]
MDILLLRPIPANERWGLGPFFRVEPLGMEYIGAALIARGHRPTIVDLRFGDLKTWLRRTRARLVGIACMHALEYGDCVKLARDIRRLAPDVTIIIGGHASAAYPKPLFDPAVDAVVVDDGESSVPAIVEALEKKRPLTEVPGLWARTADNTFIETPAPAERTTLDAVPLPARELVERHRNEYMVVTERPIYLLETARGCPFRCSFCSIWQLYDRSFRERSIDNVVRDFELVGDKIFIADDLFWHRTARSRELARALKKKGIKKDWFLVQTRTDLVARHADLLEEWRPLANRIDIFFGLEAPSDDGLDNYSKDSSTAATREACKVARSMGYGITGNFMVDPNWDEAQFQQLWDFVAENQLWRAGYTIHTPLPGTKEWAHWESTVGHQPWAKWDMHHLLWQPKLGTRRFFELFAETWRRSVLNMGNQDAGKRMWNWFKQLEIDQIPQLVKVMLQTQRIMNAKAYEKEHQQFERMAPVRKAPPPRTELDESRNQTTEAQQLVNIDTSRRTAKVPADARDIS